MRKLLTLFVILISVSSAHAEPKAVKSFRQDAKTLLSNAIGKGLHKVNGFSLDQILVELDQPRIIMNPHLIAQYENRFGGAYQFGDTPDTNWVMVNPKAYAVTPPDLRPMWMLHELLGVLRYPDHEYSMTVQIFLAAQGFDSRPFVKNLIRSHNPIELAGEGGGSGTSGGGGGDPEIIKIKLQLLALLEKIAEAVPTYEGVPVDRLTQIAVDCGFEFYSGEYAVRQEDLDRRFYNSSTKQEITVPWSVVRIRRDWYLAQTSEGQPTHMDLLLKGLVLAAQSKRKGTLCQDPGREWIISGSMPAGF